MKEKEKQRKQWTGVGKGMNGGEKKLGSRCRRKTQHLRLREEPGTTNDRKNKRGHPSESWKKEKTGKRGHPVPEGTFTRKSK